MAGWRFLGRDFVFVGAQHGLWKNPFDNIDQKPVNAFQKPGQISWNYCFLAEILHQVRLVVVEIPLFTWFGIHPGGCLGIISSSGSIGISCGNLLGLSFWIVSSYIQKTMLLQNGSKDWLLQTMVDNKKLPSGKLT